VSTPSVEGYQGCYIDSQASRDLPTKAASGTNMTIASCLRICKAKNYSFAGLQWARECWCGNAFGRYGKDVFASCNSSCLGDRTQMCGAGLRNSVYAVGAVAVVRVDSAPYVVVGHHSFPWAVVITVIVCGVLFAVVLLVVAVVLLRRVHRQRESQVNVRQQLLAQ